MARNPLSGEVFLFLGKSKGMIKILHWQKDGFILYTKKLDQLRFSAEQELALTEQLHQQSIQLHQQ